MTLKLSSIPAMQVEAAQQAALMRMQLYLTGATHQVFGELGRELGRMVIGAANAQGGLDGLGLAQVMPEMTGKWRAALVKWRRMFDALMTQAASLPFGSLAVRHQNYFKPEMKKLESQYSPGTVFSPQLQAVLDAAQRRLYQDGLTLSGRIWRMDQQAILGMQQVLYSGVAGQKSAWEIAKELEQYLGAGQECPRWTRTRLYRLTKKDIAAGDGRGLVSGGDCAGQGVAYNALRLARTEIQAVHHMADDAVRQATPWIKKEQIVLSHSHPKPDICDDVVQAGEGGQGIYPVGTIRLPLHPNCLCFKVSVQISEEEFGDKLADWVSGGQWPEMDQYGALIGQTRGIDLVDLSSNVIAMSLAVWLSGSMDDLFRIGGIGL